MTTNDRLLAKLPAAAREEFVRALAEPADAYAKRSAHAAKAWDAVGIPKGAPAFPVHSLASSFDDTQRAALEYSARNGLGAFPYSCPAAPKTLLAWLGLAQGVLETHVVLGEPLWRALQIARDIGKQGRILDALPFDVALRAIGELYTTGSGYRINTGLLLPHGNLRLFRELKDEGRAWAIAQADMMHDVPKMSSALRAFVFLALVRAKVPIAPKWDWFYPSLPGAAKSLLFECAHAIPEERRAMVVGPHLRSMAWAVEMVAEFPTAEMARALLTAEEPNSPRWFHFVEQMRALGKKHPAIAKEVDAAVSRSPEPIDLRLTRVVKPRDVSELTPLEREQLRIGVRGLLHARAVDEQDRDAQRSLANDDWEKSIRGWLEIRNVADAEDKPLYDVFLYFADSGIIFRAGTTEEIGYRVQGGVDLKVRDSALRDALQVAVNAKPPASAKKAKPAAKKKTSAKPAPRARKKK